MDCFYTTCPSFGGYKVPRRKLNKPPLTWTLGLHIIGADKRILGRIKMKTCTTSDVYNSDNLMEFIGCTISDWNGQDEIENWDGLIVVVENGVIIAAQCFWGDNV